MLYPASETVDCCAIRCLLCRAEHRRLHAAGFLITLTLTGLPLILLQHSLEINLPLHTNQMHFSTLHEQPHRKQPLLRTLRLYTPSSQKR